MPVERSAVPKTKIWTESDGPRSPDTVGRLVPGPTNHRVDDRKFKSRVDCDCNWMNHRYFRENGEVGQKLAMRPLPSTNTNPTRCAEGRVQTVGLSPGDLEHRAASAMMSVDPVPGEVFPVELKH